MLNYIILISNIFLKKNHLKEYDLTYTTSKKNDEIYTKNKLDFANTLIP